MWWNSFSSFEISFEVLSLSQGCLPHLEAPLFYMHCYPAWFIKFHIFSVFLSKCWNLSYDFGFGFRRVCVCVLKTAVATFNCFELNVRCSHLISEYLCVRRLSNCDKFQFEFASHAIALHSLWMCHRIWMGPSIAVAMLLLSLDTTPNFKRFSFDFSIHICKFRYNIHFCHNWHSK